MHTYRAGGQLDWTAATWPAGAVDEEEYEELDVDTTTWTYHAATGLLASKAYADSSAVTYTYTADGKLETRTWARDITTTYGYNEDTGELETVEYSDDTPDVTYTRDRLGRIATVKDGASPQDPRMLMYNGALQLDYEFIPGLFQHAVSRTYATSAPVIGRPTGVMVGTSQVTDLYYSTTWGYDDQGRLERVTGPGLPGNGVLYAYEQDSDLVAVTAYVDGSDESYGTATRMFEDYRDGVERVTNRWKVSGQMTTVSQYTYLSDALARRTSVVTTGSAFNPGRFTIWDYNDRNELTESRRYNGTDIEETDPVNEVPNQQFIFEYDPIGNRESYLGDGFEGAMTYTANSRNQYTATSQPAEDFEYDADGNLTEDRKYGYWYDGENRLIRAEPVSLFYAPDDRQVRFTYDYMGRRVRKLAYPRSGSGWSETPSLDRRFIYDGWNLLLELDGLNNNTVVTKFTWGLDLSGQNGGAADPNRPDAHRDQEAAPSGLHGAGGIGGLLAMTNTMGTSSTNDDRHFAYFYDANGNVGQLVDSDPSSGTFGQIRAGYQYYPFGGLLSWFTTVGVSNPFMFSTKYRDSETSLYYYGHRYLIPRLGRWLNRDPIGELGGWNLYAAMRNDPVDRFDPDGRACIAGFGCLGPQPPTSGPAPGSTAPPTTMPGCSSQPTTKPAYVPHGDHDCGATICNDVCSRTEGDLARAGGMTLCDGKGGVCTCVCEKRIRDRFKGGYSSEIIDIHIMCTGAHEGRHAGDFKKAKRSPCIGADGKPLAAGTLLEGPTEGECDAYDSEFDCIGESAPLDCERNNSCMRYLLGRLEKCREQCKDEKRCKAAYDRAWGRIKKRKEEADSKTPE